MGMNYSNITACYATGEVKATIASGEAYAGGVVGRIPSYAAVTACYATGNVTATQGYNAGGVVGTSEGGSTITVLREEALLPPVITPRARCLALLA